MTQPPEDADLPPSAEPIAPPVAGRRAMDKAKAERAARLAQALRANLKRRKAPGRSSLVPPTDRN